ncbi:bifunctional metallophosphatase/5'-nucleotidase [Agrococcus baldri]|uniref:5'-nucleotidase n=1 Tax=Agrococcus baldri TaxID=153730 RepID=A0AA87UT54_9MICO|nr:bifunctional UDP-sugar hydrolase/5'-nucleotidase [Agrococcus baldri]GEK81150.1 hypothetical protein ABA31_25010 [Agrococcus baldri]
MNKHAKRNLAAGAACAVGLGVLVAPQAAVAAPITVDPAETAVVNLIHFNDFHGRLDDNTPAFAGTVEELRADQGEEHSLVLSGGDSIGASLFSSSSQQDTPTLEVLNAMEIDASAVGNHEFDRGIDDLQGRVRDTADFPYLGAGVTQDGTAIDEGYELFEVDGVMVGVIGAVTQETPSLVSPAGIEGVEFGDPVAAVNAIADRLSDGDAANGEADVVVAEYHEGAEVDLEPNAPQADQSAALESAMADSAAFRSIVEETSPAVDVIFNGHTHQTYSWLAPAPEGAENETRPVVQGSSYGELISQVVLTVDRATGAIEVEIAQNVARTETAVDVLAQTYPRVAQVQEITTAALEQAAIIGNEEIGELTGDITTAFADGERDDRASASTLGTLMANVMLDAGTRQDAQIGIVNPGGLRDELLFAASGPETRDGVIRLGEASAVAPFANNIWTVDVTGEQLTQVLEEQWQLDADGNVPSRPYLQLGLSDNVRYTFDSTAAQGSRITGVWVDGQPLDPAASYRVAAPVFLTSGGDNFHTLADGTNVTDTGLVDIDAFVSYIQEQSPLSPDFARAQLEVVGLPGGPVAGGEQVSLTVNGIDLTSLGAPVSEELELWHGDAQLGAFPVAEGSAAVAFEAPALAEAATETFELRTASGTAVPFQLELVPGAQPTEPPVETEDPTDEPTETPAPGAGDDDGSQAGGGSLPRTGGEVSPMLWVGAGLLVLIGAALLIVGRLRRAQQ